MDSYTFFVNCTANNFFYDYVYKLNHTLSNIALNFFVFTYFLPRFWLLNIFFFFDEFRLLQFWKLNILTSLTVGFYNIHPPILYLSILLGGISIYSYSVLNNFSRVSLLYSSCFSFFLGGYWGLGNSIWGYYWVNDIVEIALLLFLVILLFFSHFFKQSSVVFLYSVNLLFFIFLLVLLRVGLIQTRHSFFNAQNLQNLIVFFSGYTNYNFLLSFFFFQILTWPFVLVCCLPLIFLCSQYLNKLNKSFFLHLLFLVFVSVWVQYAEHNLTVRLGLVKQIFQPFFLNTTLKTGIYLLIVKKKLLVLTSQIFYFTTTKFLFKSIVVIKYIYMYLFFFFFKKR